jgi:hypothetical protein
VRVVVIAERDPGPPVDLARRLEPARELLPLGNRRVVRVRDDALLVAEDLGVGDGLVEVDAVDADVGRRRPQVVPVEDRAELGGGAPVGAGELHLAVADVGQRLQVGLQVDLEDRPERVQLDADLVLRHPAAPPVPAALGARGGG